MSTSQATGWAVAPRKAPAPKALQGDGIVLTPERIEAFLSHQAAGHAGGDTVKRYRHDLNLLYTDLPSGKELRRGTLAWWRESLLERGYAASTVNVSISAVNGFLAYWGRRELQLMERLEPRSGLQPEMTRPEYLRLLGTARALGKRQLYLLIKLFAGTGLPVQNLPEVTVEAVSAGRVAVMQGGIAQFIHIPACLQQELLDFAGQTGRHAGTLFVTGSGAPLGRTNVSGGIRRLCKEAQVPEEKGNPRCLRRLYQATRDGINANISLLVEQAHEQLLETEQRTIGWEQDLSVNGETTMEIQKPD